MHILVLVLLLYFLPMLDAAAYCKKTSRGVEVKYSSPTEPRSFYCLEVRRNLVRRVASPIPGYYGYCKIFKKKVSDIQYRRHDLETGIRCRYKCGLPVHTCRSPVVSGKCICKKSRPRLIIERAAPVDVYSPHGGRITGPCSLRGRGEGFEFGEIVSCMAITVKVDKTRVAYAPGSTDTCTVKRSEQEETKFMEAFVQSTGVRKCVHVCRKRSPQCVGDPKRGKCACKSRSLVKLLIPLSESETNSQTKLSCKNSGCGPCGVCKREKCVLKRYAQSKNLCPCGTVCPLKSQLSRDRSPAASILCRQNPALECRAKRYQRGPKPGTVNPDYCYESKKKDYLDTCGCAPGFVLKPLKESPESICVAKE